MKFLIVIIAFLSLNNGCSQSKINQDAISLEYSAHSRGTFKNILINKKSISVSNKHDSTHISKPCSHDYWNKIIKELNQIEIKNIPNLKAPSENRFFDGAAIASLKITYNGKTYESQNFDHGDPPKEITQLIKEMLSISENIE